MPSAESPAWLKERVHEDAVGTDEGDLVVAHAGPDLVLDELGRVVLDDAAEVDGVGLSLRDLVHQRTVVGRRAVDALAADDLYALFFRSLLELVGEALAVGLLVVEDERTRSPPPPSIGRRPDPACRRPRSRAA